MRVKLFALYSLRPTYGMRFGEAGADVFAIMRLMGYSSVMVNPQYMDRSPEAGNGRLKGWKR